MNKIESTSTENEKTLIIIVEDDEMTQIMTKTILEMSGYRVISAYNGLECLNLLNSKVIPSVILMDVMMPVMNGLECLRQLKTNSEFDYIPIIFLTAINDLDIIKECFDLEATDFILKPFKNIEILARIGAAAKLSKKNLDLKQKKDFFEKQNKEITNKIYTYETQNNELKRIDEAKDNFISAVTHDFKTPLTGIRSISEMMMYNPIYDKKSTNENLNFIISQVDILNRMIHVTLQSLKKIPDISQIKPCRINVKTFLGKISNDCTLISQSKNIQFEFHNLSDIEELEIDEDKMYEVLSNLFSNSIKYGKNSTITLKTFNDDQIYFISIEDTGDGIPPGEEDVIFTKFYRSDDDSPIDGDGLGLYISKKIILAHNGNIKAINKPSGGAQFIISLPLKEKNI
ncbi:MAG: hypothetical protein A2015_10580 [Spirochaetes bacterium GWF1_31_7]|nr:MAG: hypothetical protein A2Y30_16320 [Spirochaetes bacterium GWE1_32_154]OHD48541.1 MAG: hypothetical protein A2Y29_14295 [Spirochaetes bacterium GWE2_31_10]OHD51459.1 MAG: hypothetical protein A2015_10580 [Spirochaetes bacterium GWF1_31_7]OHD78117.1 MAG: hypothetical protein A2355_12955 [Spirochaetes bacterium RIFOXYB1_FULL_32_8]HBD93326.1 hypothetical protein [Spirochaetia bacterium]